MKTLTANRLTDGRVIYRTPAGQWSTQIAEAQTLSDIEADYLLPIAEAEFGIAVGPYLIDVDEDGPAGQKWRREKIRLQGPSTGTTHVLGAA
jgi:hypothetical protein